MLVRSCLELESEYIRYLEAVLKKSVVPVGLLIPEASSISPGQRNDCLSWLESHPPGSVVCVSFGSECFLSKEQVAELAKGAGGEPCPISVGSAQPSLRGRGGGVHVISGRESSGVAAGGVRGADEGEGSGVVRLGPAAADSLPSFHWWVCEPLRVELRVGGGEVRGEDNSATNAY